MAMAKRSESHLSTEQTTDDPIDPLKGIKRTGSTLMKEYLSGKKAWCVQCSRNLRGSARGSKWRMYVWDEQAQLYISDKCECKVWLCNDCRKGFDYKWEVGFEGVMVKGDGNEQGVYGLGDRKRFKPRFLLIDH